MPRKQDLKSLTVKDLKDKLACKKLPQTGKKADMVKRLELHALKRKTLADRAKREKLPVTGSKAMLVRRLESKKPLKGDIVLKKPKSVPAKQRAKTRCVSPKRKATPKRKAPVKPRFAKRKAKTPPPRKATKKPRRRIASTKRSVAERSLDEQLRELEESVGLPPAKDVPAMVEELRGKTLQSRLQGKTGIEKRLRAQKERQLELVDASEIDPKVSLALSRTNKDFFHSLLDLGEAEDASGLVLRDVVAAYYDRILDLWIPFDVLGEDRQFSKEENISDLYKEYDVVTRETGVYLLLVLSGQIDNLLRLVEDLQEPGQRGKVAERLREKLRDVAIEVPLPKLVEIEYPRFARGEYLLYKAKPLVKEGLFVPVLLLGEHPYLAEGTFGPDDDLAGLYNKYGVIPEFSGEYLVLVRPGPNADMVKAHDDFYYGKAGSKRKKEGLEALKLITEGMNAIIPVPYVPRGRQIYKKR